MSGIMEWSNMAKPMRDAKLRTLIKAFLVFNRGKRFTAKQISDWINGEWFGFNRSLINARVVGQMLARERHQSSNILSEVQMETINNLKEYWVE